MMKISRINPEFLEKNPEYKNDIDERDEKELKAIMDYAKEFEDYSEKFVNDLSQEEIIQWAEKPSSKEIRHKKCYDHQVGGVTHRIIIKKAEKLGIKKSSDYKICRRTHDKKHKIWVRQPWTIAEKMVEQGYKPDIGHTYCSCGQRTFLTTFVGDKKFRSIFTGKCPDCNEIECRFIKFCTKCSKIPYD
jgi:hypothetical protein